MARLKRSFRIVEANNNNDQRLASARLRSGGALHDSDIAAALIRQASTGEGEPTRPTGEAKANSELWSGPCDLGLDALSKTASTDGILSLFR